MIRCGMCGGKVAEPPKVCPFCGEAWTFPPRHKRPGPPNPTRAERAIRRSIAKLAPEPGSGVSSVTISIGDRSVTLTAEDRARLERS